MLAPVLENRPVQKKRKCFFSSEKWETFFQKDQNRFLGSPSLFPFLSCILRRRHLHSGQPLPSRPVPFLPSKTGSHIPYAPRFVFFVRIVILALSLFSLLWFTSFHFSFTSSSLKHFLIIIITVVVWFEFPPFFQRCRV